MILVNMSPCVFAAVKVVFKMKCYRIPDIELCYQSRSVLQKLANLTKLCSVQLLAYSDAVRFLYLLFCQQGNPERFLNYMYATFLYSPNY
jgi:hypothetical protein